MIYEKTEIDGFMSGDELDWLFERAQTMDSIVEIGSWKGLSTHALLSGCMGTVFAVDTFLGSPDEIEGAHIEARDHDIYQIFYRNVGHFKNLVTMRMESVKAAQFFRSQSIDMIFIDGSHKFSDIMIDLLSWVPICKNLICGHDIHEAGVPRALSLSKLNFKKEIGCLWSAEV